MNLDPRFASHSHRKGSKDQSLGMSTKVVGPGAKDDGWNNDDGHSLLEMGDINVESGWEVIREQRGSGRVSNPHVLGRPAHFKSTKNVA